MSDTVFPVLRGAAALLLLCAIAGCYWWKYEELVRTHVELLVAMAEKMESLVGREDRTRRMSMSEFRYPLDRARDFARIVRSRRGAAESFRRFEAFLDGYEALVAEADRLRTEGGRNRAQEFGRRVAGLREAGVAVLAAL